MHTNESIEIHAKSIQIYSTSCKTMNKHTNHRTLIRSMKIYHSTTWSDRPMYHSTLLASVYLWIQSSSPHYCILSPCQLQSTPSPVECSPVDRAAVSSRPVPPQSGSVQPSAVQSISVYCTKESWTKLIKATMVR